MVNLEHYIKAKAIATRYLDNIRMLDGTTHKQHFLVRLSKCQDYSNMQLSPKLFTFVTKELEWDLNHSFDEIYDKIVSENDSNGYMKAINKVVTPEIKFYFAMTDILDQLNVLLRNNINRPESDNQKNKSKLKIPDVSSKLTTHNIRKMLDIAKADTVMRELEGTQFVNGVGGLRNTKIMAPKLVGVSLQAIDDVFEEIFKYYIEDCNGLNVEKGKRLHSRIYGLTHCIINLSNFYENFVNMQLYNGIAKDACGDLLDILKSQHRCNYKDLNSDTLAEILLCIKLCNKGLDTEYLNALSSLSMRFNSADSTTILFP